MSELLQYSGQYYRKPPQGDVEFQHLWKVMDDIQAAMRNAGLSEAQIAALLGGYVQSVTGLDTDNTDPQNPVVQIAVDGVTITGDGTPGNPLVSSGGGGTPSAPDGSVQFNDGGSFGGEADLYWDKVQDRLGIGTDTPECTLDVRSGGTTNTRGVQVTHYDNTTAFSQAKFIGRRSRGSVGSPSAVQADDTLASFNARGRHNTGWSNTVGGAYIYAANNWTNTSTGTYLTWRGVPTGSTTVAEWMRLNQSGLRLASLAGVGTRMVVADTNGDLSTQAIPSAPDASTTVKGVTKLSVAPVLASNPIAVGDNDPRLVNQAYRSIVFNLYNGGYDLTTGIQDAPVIIPFAGTVTGWEIMAYDSTNTLISTSCVVDILSDTFANLPLSGTDSIAGSEKPTLSAASTNSDNTITTWSSLTLYNYVQAEIESINAGVARIVISIKVTV